jgi:hypothetical protein
VISIYINLLLLSVFVLFSFKYQSEVIFRYYTKEWSKQTPKKLKDCMIIVLERQHQEMWQLTHDLWDSKYKIVLVDVSENCKLLKT